MKIIDDDYLTDNKDFAHFLDVVSERTGERNRERWLKNLRENRSLFKNRPWATEALHDAERGKTAIVMGSSPAISKQVETLQEIQHDGDFVLCGISSNLEFLLNNEIYPKYVIAVDADESQGEQWASIDMEKTKNISLIANTLAYPPQVRSWKGPIYPIVFTTHDKEIKAKQNKWYKPINGIGAEFPSLMCQFNIMAGICFLTFGTHVIIFVGNELSYQTEQSTYYMDRADPRDEDCKWRHGDIYGNLVYTTHNLLSIKISLEWFLGKVAGAGWFFNCTEAGIFGITKRFKDRHVPWIKQFTLKNGIAQARHIMRTGQPFYSYSPGSIVKVPAIEQDLSFASFH